MTERLKQVSLRKFRETIVDVHEVVEVSRRDPGGNIQILGYWTPYMTHPADAVAVPTSLPIDYSDPTDGTYDPRTEATVGVAVKYGELEIPVDEFPVSEDTEFDRHPLTAKVINTPEEAAVAVAPNPVRAVPKPSQRKKR